VNIGTTEGLGQHGISCYLRQFMPSSAEAPV